MFYVKCEFLNNDEGCSKESSSGNSKSMVQRILIQIPKSNNDLSKEAMEKAEFFIIKLDLDLEQIRKVGDSEIKLSDSDNIEGTSIKIEHGWAAVDSISSKDGISYFPTHFYLYPYDIRKGVVINHPELNEALRNYFGADFRVVYSYSQDNFYEKAILNKNTKLKPFDEQSSLVNFHEIAPYLIIQQEDVDHINKVIKENSNGNSVDPVEDVAFRPNIVIKGTDRGLVEEASW
eukprot:CAMPEP_0170518962 /NCGR_PEP_ID=MMETSP0209-20121228/4531_1 /TAXON_ID=665100 ORGANISM="Litonotus pictus, Strain P1" /NCGR_SAMPLE_ID=MMETSP0209 /ASSEMBLY_ACC=CAM_ASM_000301 /LENGTH=232 /DNA_ID=CAMNT_0010804715 /DNA_START=162 /DNA_END=857 /DNA_ORIENTATION=+